MKNAKSPILAALRDAAVDEQLAVQFLENQRWGNTPSCPRCGDVSVYRMRGSKGGRNVNFRWRCRGCKKMFTVRTNTPLEESRLPLKVWVYAFWKACSSKKGISALQLSREMEITHKSALFVLRRIRHGVAPDISEPLTGIVEVDELYVGGKFKGQYKAEKPSNKTPVVNIVQRDGEMRSFVMPKVTGKNIMAALGKHISKDVRLMTDTSTVYKTIKKLYKHESVNHSAGEYVRGDVSTNMVESTFSLLTRGVIGTFHCISAKHLPNYLNEFAFRWNTRKLDDGARVSTAIKAVDGKRLKYRESVDNPPYSNKG